MSGFRWTCDCGESFAGMWQRDEHVESQVCTAHIPGEFARASLAIANGEVTRLRAEVEALRGELRIALIAARMLREALADMVNQHGTGMETALSANEGADDALHDTRWLDAADEKETTNA